jgi:hypothetical protein
MQSPEVSTKYLRAFAIFSYMRITADIAAIITIIALGVMVRRKDALLNAQRRANATLMNSNQRLFNKLDDKISGY